MAQWGQLRGELVEVRQLAATLRTIADQHGKTIRGLEKQMPYKRTAISQNLNGARRPDWAFVEAFLQACAGRDEHGSQLLIKRIRPLWEAADPERATLLPAPVKPVPEEQAVRVVPEPLQAWVAALGEVAERQLLLARAQLSVSRHQALMTGLLEMLGRLSEAVQTLVAERDALRIEQDRLGAERELRSKLEVELGRIRAQMVGTQQRLEATQRLQAQTHARLREAEQQYSEADRLRRQAQEQLRHVLVRVDPDADPRELEAAAARRQGRRAELELAAVTLMGATDQRAAAVALGRVDDLLHSEAADLAELRDTLRSVPAGASRVEGAHGVGSARTRGRRLFIVVAAALALVVVLVVALRDEVFHHSGPAHSALATTPALGTVSSIAFSADGKTLALCGLDHRVFLRNSSTGEPIGSPLTGHTDVVISLAFSPDGKTLASGSADKTVRLWDVATGKPIGQPLTGHTDFVNSLAFSPDGKTLASGSADKTVRLWDVATGKPIGQPLADHTGPIWSVAFSPDGKTVASGGDEGPVWLWDVVAGKPTGQPFTGHTAAVWSVAFSPDGKTLASGSADKTVRLWNVATGKPIGQLRFPS